MEFCSWSFAITHMESEYSIFYHNDVSGDPHLVDIQGYVDSDWVGDVDRRRSTSGYVFQLFGGVVSWMRK
jgi:hypothetical protein